MLEKYYRLLNKTKFEATELVFFWDLSVNKEFAKMAKTLENQG